MIHLNQVARNSLPRLTPALMLLSVMVLVTPSVMAQRTTPASDSLDRMNESIDALTRKVWPSVVQIVVTSYGPREQSPTREMGVIVGRSKSVGSGFVGDA